MMNPNTHCATCEKPIYRSSNKMFKRNFCNMACRTDYPVRWIGFVYANRHILTIKQMSAYINMPSASLRTWLGMYNSWGVHISFPKGPRIKDGIGCRERAQLDQQKKRQEREQRKLELLKSKRPKIQKVVKPLKPSPSNHGKPPKKDPAKFETRVVPFNPATHRMVKVNNRTWKQVLIDNNLKTA